MTAGDYVHPERGVLVLEVDLNGLQPGDEYIAHRLDGDLWKFEVARRPDPEVPSGDYVHPEPPSFADLVEIADLLREGGWDGNSVVDGVRGLIAYAEQLRIETQDENDRPWDDGWVQPPQGDYVHPERQQPMVSHAALLGLRRDIESAGADGWIDPERLRFGFMAALDLLNTAEAKYHTAVDVGAMYEAELFKARAEVERLRAQVQTRDGELFESDQAHKRRETEIERLRAQLGRLQHDNANLSRMIHGVPVEAWPGGGTDAEG